MLFFDREKSKLGEVDHTLELMVSFIQEQIVTEEAKSKNSGDAGVDRSLRGPYLARLELIQQLTKRGAGEEARERIGELVMFFILEDHVLEWQMF